MKKRIIITAAVLLVSVLIIRHIVAENSIFYKVPYEKTDISDILKKEKLSEEDYMLIYEQTGVAPAAADELIKTGNTKFLTRMHELYFKEPATAKCYIAKPFTLEERNETQITPIVPLKKGDILVTFNTRTLDWRHGHCSLVLNDYGSSVLEHVAIGKTSCISPAYFWGSYPAFAVLRYSDGTVAANAADYARENLLDIPYSLFAGLVIKDKTDEKSPSSHCSHIVWQAYKAVGADIDSNGGSIVTPKDIARSDKLKVVQIYGLNPKNYTSRILK